MKPKTPTHSQRAAFTLVEMLVVIAIIVILLAILIPAVARAKINARIAQTKMEMAGLKLAINSYHNDYNRWPTPKNAARNVGDDITFGWKGWGVSNEALIQILMAKDGSFNPNHSRNPKKNKYIDLRDSGEADNLPGLSTSGRYHDPFGNEYFISIDMNADGFCVDQFYGRPEVEGGVFGLTPPNAADGVSNIAVVKDPNGGSSFSKMGLTGLKRTKVKGREVYGLQGQVMIWTYGPDRFGHRDVPAFGTMNIDRNGAPLTFGQDGFFADATLHPVNTMGRSTLNDLMFWSWSDDTKEMKYDANGDGRYVSPPHNFGDLGYHCMLCKRMWKKTGEKKWKYHNDATLLEHGIDGNRNGVMDPEDAVNDDNILSWK